MLTRRRLLAALATQAPRPNLIVITSDDHHYQCLGAAGNPHIATPNLDRLASRGVDFTHGIVSTSQCCPSRGILLSGLETYQSGLMSNGYKAFKPDLGPTVVEQLRRAGYATHLVGKWHITNSPATCGFSHAPLWLRGGSSKYIDPELRRGLDGEDEAVPGHITELFSNTAIDVIRGATQPYLMWLAYNAPHTPYTVVDGFRPKSPQPPPVHPKDAAEFDWSTYYAVISHLDAHLGRVIKSIEQAGQWENTLVVFLGDNGFLCGTKGLDGKVHPWEESLRVPYIVSGGAVKARGKNNSPVASIDIPATLLDYAGVRPAYALSGGSLRPELTGRPSRRQHSFAVWNDGRPEGLATRQAVEPYRVVRSRTHKLIVWESGKQALYEIDGDPGETNNLFSKRQQLAVELRKVLARRMRTTNDPALGWLSR